MVVLLDAMSIVTETAITVPSVPGATSYAGACISDLQIVYTFDEENTLQAVDLFGKINTVISEETVEMEVSLTVEFAAEAITGFEQIGGYTVNVPDADGGMTTTTVAGILNNGSAE